MALLNNQKQFGFITKFFHWLIFLLFIVQYYLVYRREYFDDKSPEKLQYILLHKSIGVVLLFVAIIFLAFHFLGKRPKFEISTPLHHIIAAKITHFLLFIAMFIMPVSGIAMSQLSGYPIKVFGLYQFPTLLEMNKPIGKIIFGIHVYSSYVIIALVAIHSMAALYHHFIMKDNILKRMLFSK